MTKEEADSLKKGDVVYRITNDADGKRVYLNFAGTIYIRGTRHGQLLVSHSPKSNMACWSEEREVFHKDQWCLAGGVQQACRKVAVGLLQSRLNHAESKLKEAQSEFDLIAGTTPDSLIDTRSNNGVIEGAEKYVKENPITL